MVMWLIMMMAWEEFKNQHGSDHEILCSTDLWLVDLPLGIHGLFFHDMFDRLCEKSSKLCDFMVIFFGRESDESECSKHVSTSCNIFMDFPEWRPIVKHSWRLKHRRWSMLYSIRSHTSTNQFSMLSQMMGLHRVKWKHGEVVILLVIKMILCANYETNSTFSNKTKFLGVPLSCSYHPMDEFWIFNSRFFNGLAESILPLFIERILTAIRTDDIHLLATTVIALSIFWLTPLITGWLWHRYFWGILLVERNATIQSRILSWYRLMSYDSALRYGITRLYSIVYKWSEE